MGSCTAVAVGLLGLTGPAALGSAAPVAALVAAIPAGTPVGSAVLVTSGTELVRAPAVGPRAARSSSVVRGWTPTTVRVATAALRRVYTFRVTANGPGGRKVLVQRASGATWRTLAVTRTGFGAGHAFRVSLVVPRGTTAWRLLLPRTPLATGIATGTKRFVVGGLVAPVTPGPTPGTTVTIAMSPTATPTSGPGQGAAYANHFSYLTGGTQAFSAARWDRCRPIRVTGDFARVGKAGLSVLGERARWIAVLTKVAAASGYRFVWLDSWAGRGTIRADGDVTGMPTHDKTASGAYAPGAAHADIVVTYASASDPGPYRARNLDGATVGYGGPAWVSHGSPTRRQSIAGEVILDYADIAEMDLSTGTITDLYLHEFGHVMGLGHFSDPTQVMNPALPATPLLDYRRGDREGLVALHAQPCTST